MTTRQLSNIVASPSDNRDLIFNPALTTLPSSVDNRSYNLPIRDQAQEGDCVGFGVLRALENMAMRRGRNERLSTQFPYYVTRNAEGRLAQEGTWIRDVLEMGRSYGLPLESEWPYMASNENTQPTPDVYASAGWRLIKRYESIPIDTTGSNIMLTINNLKAAIAESAASKGSTVIFAIKLSNQFYGLTGPLAQQNYLGLASSQYYFIGNHCMTADGFDDAMHGGSFICGNQWGPWGDAGYGAIPYVTMATDMIEAWIVRSYYDVDMTDYSLYNLRSQVTQLFIAMFGRSGAKDGIAYWVGQLQSGVSLAQVAQNMYACDPARAYYPAGSTNSQIVTQFYVNVLGRQPGAGGLSYWTAQLDSGQTPGQVIVSMLASALSYTGTDTAALFSQRLVNNKLSVGMYCGVDLAVNDVSICQRAFTYTTDDPASVDPSRKFVRYLANPLEGAL